VVCNILNIQRFAVHDGPGIRTAVFFKGCPLRCIWCHNPESQAFHSEILYSADRCRLCKACAAVCPHHIIVPTDECDHCGACVNACAAEARVLAGREMSVPEILREIERDVIFFDESGGGVTFTGGEPLAQPAALEALLVACRDHRIHTAIETCGAAAPDTLLRLCGLADLVLYDVKFVDSDRHRQFTGAPNTTILANLTALLRVHPNVLVRVPVIPGVNDTEDFRSLCDTLPIHPAVQLMPYHRAGVDKYRRLGREYQLPDTEPPTAPEMSRITALCGAGTPARRAGTHAGACAATVVPSPVKEPL
jgi:pyruvate formate lyase activating enzyme